MNRFLFLFVALCGLASTAAGQLRQDVPTPYHWTGVVTKPITQTPNGQSVAPWLNQVRMRHSYEMTMGSFGGQMYNRNYYTNTLLLDFNEKLSGRMDVAFAHSPFGNGMMMNQGPQVFLRNAELQYRFTDRAVLNVSFRHEPGAYGMTNPFFRGY